MKSDPAEMAIHDISVEYEMGVHRLNDQFTIFYR
jgi:hypothetical protein